MILIIASKRDVASLNIKSKILEEYDFGQTSNFFEADYVYETEFDVGEAKLVTLNKDLVHAQDIAEQFCKPELLIFLSRHSSHSGKPTLSVHTPGNLSEARFGGIAGKVSVSPAGAMRDVLRNMSSLTEEADLAYEISYECTHHGPSLDSPTMFVELGSSPKQWMDSKAAEVVARATMKAVLKPCSIRARAVIGLGGPHYNSRFTKMALHEGLAFGHMVPKYAIENLDVEILKQCVEKTLETVTAAVLDWKGIEGRYKPQLVNMLDRLGLSYERIRS